MSRESREGFVRRVMESIDENHAVAVVIGNNRPRRVRLDGRKENRELADQAAKVGALLGVYDLRCQRQWIEEDLSFAGFE